MSWEDLIRLILEFLHGFGVLGGALICFGLLYSLVKRPFTKIGGFLQKSIKDVLKKEFGPETPDGGGELRIIIKEIVATEIAPVKQVLDELSDDMLEMKHCEIMAFADDLRLGVEKTPNEWSYNLRASTEYLKTGRNGKVQATAEFIVDEFKKR